MCLSARHITIKLRYVLESAKIRLSMNITFCCDIKSLNLMSSKEVRFPTAIGSLKGIVFVRNICTPAGWREKLYW